MRFFFSSTQSTASIMKKSWNEKLNDDKDLPKIVKIEGKMLQRFGKGKMVIPAPLEVDRRMKQVRRGKLTTIDAIRNAIADEHSAHAT